MRLIVVPYTKAEIAEYTNDVNYELTGKQIELDEKKFKLFWDTNIINQFYKKTGKLIDDFETTIIDDDSELLILKEIIEASSFNFFESSLKNDLLLLVNYANKKKSGVIFFF